MISINVYIIQYVVGWKAVTTATDWCLHVIKPKWITAELIWQELQNHLPHDKLMKGLQENLSESSIWQGDVPQHTLYGEAVRPTQHILIELWSFHYVWHRSTSSFQNPMGNFLKSPRELHKKMENVIAAFFWGRSEISCTCHLELFNQVDFECIFLNKNVF